jgi:uncharacterized circularly permuted ATP-grasp superfamily protein
MEMMDGSEQGRMAQHELMDAETARVYRGVMDRLGFDGRSQLAMKLSAMVRQLSEEGVRSRHPEYSERQVKLAAIKLAIGRELFARVYPGEKVEP